MGNMIRNVEEFRREAEVDRWDRLRRMSPEESIALGEALLTSEIMNVAEFPDDDHPLSLAIAIEIRPIAART